MRDIHRSTTTWLARRTGRGSTARPLHRSHRRRLTLEPLEGRALLSLTTWTVNSLGDTGTGSGTSGDLRYVITQADQTTGDNTINFAVTGTITLKSALPDLSNTAGLMDIEGPGANNLTVSGNNEVRVFQVDSGVTAKLVGLTITGGSADSGGGIYNAGTLTVTNSTIDNNSASSYGTGSYGGGIDNTGTLTVTNSTIDNNSASSTYGSSSGGGIDNTGTLTVTNSTIDGNNSAINLVVNSLFSFPPNYGSSYGGGIDNTGTLTVTNSTIDGNQARGYGAPGYGDSGYGGGIYNTGTLTVTNSTIDNNSASSYGSYGPGGDAFGGAVYTTGDLTLDDCTVSNNSAEGGAGYSTQGYEEPEYPGGNASGGGLYVGLGAVHINESSIEGNSALGGNGGGGQLSGVSGGGNASGGGLTITNQAQAWISQTLIAANSALGGYGGSGGGSYKGVTLVFGGDGGSASGGGLDFDGASLSLTDSSVVQNQAIGGAGGSGVLDDSGSFTHTTPPPYPYIPFVGNGGSGSGGGLAVSGPSELVSDTVSGNSASGSPGGSGTYTYGVWYQGNLQGYITVPVVGSTGQGTGGGLSGTATMDNTIVALNTQGTGSDAPASDIAGSVSGAYNLIGTGGSGGLVNGVNGNQVGVANPGLGPLAYYGGPTQTIALLPGSPAIDKGSNALAVDPSTGQPLTTDQRGPGFVRIYNGTVDIGAYEYLPAASDTVAVTWGTQTALLQTAADGLRLLPQGRTTDLPWLGIDSLQVTLSQAQTLTPADVTLNSANGVNYGPVTVSGSGTSYTITLAQPINAADRVTITIVNPGVSMFNRRLDVQPGDVNDDGVVNVQDLVAIRNQMLGLVGAVPTIFGDINGDGTVDINDYTAVRERIDTQL